MGRLVSTSKDELIIFYYICKIFPDSINRYSFPISPKESLEIDIFIPSINVGIEYDGVYWHKDKLERDIYKTQRLNENGIFVIHVREAELQPLPPFDGITLWHWDKNHRDGLHTNEYITAIMNELSNHVSDPSLANSLKNYNLSYNAYKRNLPDINSIFYTDKVTDPFSNHAISEYWDKDKNGNLNPDNIPTGTNISIFLKCPSGNSLHVNAANIGYAIETCRFNDRIHEECPLFGNPDICEKGCEYLFSKFRDDILSRVKDEKPFDNSTREQLLIACDEQMLSIIFSEYLDGRINPRYFNYSLWCRWRAAVPYLTIKSENTLILLLRVQMKNLDMLIPFKAYLFDDTSRHRKGVIQYFCYVFDATKKKEKIDQYFLACFKQLHPNKTALSNEFKQNLNEIIKKYSINIHPKLYDQYFKLT